MTGQSRVDGSIACRPSWYRRPHHHSALGQSDHVGGLSPDVASVPNQPSTPRLTPARIHRHQRTTGSHRQTGSPGPSNSA
jgi:hypothetical protein